MEPRHRVGDFSFTLELRGDFLNCIADEDRWFPLATALTSAWGTDGGFLADLLEQRCGYDKEGAVGFSYAGDGPDEAPDGMVRVHFMDDRLVLDRAFFERAAVEFGLAALAWRRKASLPVSAEVEKRLLAVRARGNA